MREGAVIDAINDTLITSYYDLERILHANPEVPLAIQWSYQGQTHTDTLIPEAKKVLKEGTKTEMEVVGQIGIGPYYTKRPVGFVSAAQMGLTATVGMTSEILSFLKLLITGKAGIDSLGGPILITQMAGDMARWGFNYLLYFLAFFSINLCIFNLLPILPFDGGHLSLFIYEGISRRQINRRVREILTQVGFALIILLMTFVVIVDISRCAGSSPGIF
jgi:regulator of sigma E protease